MMESLYPFREPNMFLKGKGRAHLRLPEKVYFVSVFLIFPRIYFYQNQAWYANQGFLETSVDLYQQTKWRRGKV